MDRLLPNRTWRRHLQWAEDYFVFPRDDLSPLIAFRFPGTGKTLIVRNKSSATYTGASIRASLIRITDSHELDEGDHQLTTELDMGNCILQFWDGTLAGQDS